ncbi:uncharacterized protein LOC142625114 [Castanea sativa]|uniref:uncharacterized protein LOC142625114 n=1 Tax=Castanea sativa TaxID=21020 RepID=UPI003F65181F
MVWTNGSSNQRAGGARVLLQTLERDTIECVVRLQFLTTNNKAEYEAVLSGIDLVEATWATLAIVHCNSQVMVKHINSDYEAKGERMKNYLNVLKSKTGDGFSVKFIQILREENEQADCLAKAASAKYTNTTNEVLSFVQYALAIDKLEVQFIPPRTDWTTLVMSYLKDVTLPEDRNAFRRLKVQSPRFAMIGDVLYKRGFSRPYLRFLM